LFERFLDASRLDEIINKGGTVTADNFPDVDCFTLDTLVLTPTGPQEIGSLCIGDEVITDNGEIKKITNIVDHKNCGTVRVCYSDWFFDCTLNHKVLIKRNQEISYRYVSEIQVGDFLVENNDIFHPIVFVGNYGFSKKTVRDIEVQDRHSFRVCGKSYNKVCLKNGEYFYLSDEEMTNIDF
jgi:hypothetical protein